MIAGAAEGLSLSHNASCCFSPFGGIPSMDDINIREAIRRPGKPQLEAKPDSLVCRLSGGGRGIRTPDTLSGITVFKTVCFNRSHIPPRDWYQQFTSSRKLPLKSDWS
jgi:hypothetical protein